VTWSRAYVLKSRRRTSPLRCRAKYFDSPRPAGDARARDWLAKYLLGAEPLGLLALAADEADAFIADKEVALEQKVRQQARFGKQLAAAWADRDDTNAGSGQR
jgi:hypothetical protein